MKKVKIGMISFAHAGHPDSYFNELIVHPGVEIIGIAEKDKNRVQPYLDKYQIPYYSDYRDMLTTDCDGVIICSEYVDHAKLTIEAAQAGKHVLCEKPLGITMEEMHRMIEVCKEQNVHLMTAFPLRFSAPVINAKQALDRGDIGELLGIKGMNRSQLGGPWFADPAQSGGGALIDHTVHVMDLMNWFVNKPVDKVYAEASTMFYDVEVEDAGMVHVTFENGVVGVIDTSWSTADSFPVTFDMIMDIVGTKGTISIEVMAQSNKVYRNQATKSEWSYWGDSIDGKMVYAFVESIVTGKRVPVTGEDGMKSAAVALAAYESVRTGAVVKMDRYR